MEASPRRPVALALLLLAVGGCSEGDPEHGADPVVLDSAGVPIVEHRAAAFEVPEWHVNVDEALRLPGEFFQITGVLRFPDGRVVVAEAGSRQLRFFGPDGTPQGAVGGEGEGPGEFRHLTGLWRWPGDSLVTFDRQLRRLSVFDGRGTLGRTFSLEITDDVPFAVVQGVHGDGSLLATGFAQSGPSGPQTGRHRYPSPAYHFRPDGSLSGILPLTSSSEGYFQTIDGGFTVYTAVFSRATRLVAGPDFTVEADNDRFELRLHTPSGAPLRIVRRAGSPPRVTETLRREAVERELARASPRADLEGLRRVLEAMPVPGTLPAYDRLHVDRSGRLWVEAYHPDPPARSEWTVFRPDGHVAARVRMPRGLQPHDIGEAYVLGVLTDGLDVERIVLAELRR